MKREEYIKEEWRDIPTYKGYYQVSNKGRVRSIDRLIPRTFGATPTLHKGKVLKQQTTHKGYKQVTLQYKGERQTFLVHRLVMICFVGYSVSGNCVNHIDCDKTNNSLSNLEWVTILENARHASENNRYNPWTKGRFGKDNPFSKPICQIDQNGNTVNSFNSIIEASNYTSINNGNIQQVCAGKRKTAGGYKWQYVS